MFWIPFSINVSIFIIRTVNVVLVDRPVRTAGVMELRNVPRIRPAGSEAVQLRLLCHINKIKFSPLCRGQKRCQDLPKLR